MIVAVTGPTRVGKSSLISRIKTGEFTLQYFPTHYTEIHKITMRHRPIVLVETNRVIECDMVLLLCRTQSEVTDWTSWCKASTISPVVVRVGEKLAPEPRWLSHEVHCISNLSAKGIAQLINCIYIKSVHINK